MNTELHEQTPAVAAMVGRRFRIAGDLVNMATKDLDDRKRGLIRWMHGHCKDKDLSLDEAGKAIRYDASTIYRVFTGKYEGSLDNVCDEIERFKELAEKRSVGKRQVFVETSLSRRIWRICDAALVYQRIVMIYGESQIGKTENLLRYKDDHNHGLTIYVRMPSGGAMTHFLEALATALRISSQQKEKELRRRILAAFDDRMLLIVDEVHQCLVTRGSNVRTIEFIREIHDLTRCGVVLVGTNVFRDEIQYGRLAGVLKQCRRRRLASLQLPAIPPRDDLDQFAKSFGLPPASGKHLDLQTTVLKEEALGMWLILLRMAKEVAVKRACRLTWSLVEESHVGLKDLEKGGE